MSYTNNQKPSAVIAGRKRLLDWVPGWISNPVPGELDDLVDWLIGSDYMSDKFFEEATEALEGDK